MRKTGLRQLLIFLLSIGIALQGCVSMSGSGGGSSSGDSGSETSSGEVAGSVSGQVLDAEGNPVQGIVVVSGDSSPTTITDEDGKYNVNVIKGQRYVTIIGGGYSATRVDFASDNPGDIGSVTVNADGVDTSCPHISDVTATIDGNTINVSAIVENADEVRAEVIGTNFGSRMSKGGGDYTAKIVVSDEVASGPITIVVIAINEDNENGDCGSTAFTTLNSEGEGTDKLNGDWAGHMRLREVGLPWAGRHLRAQVVFDLTGGKPHGTGVGTFSRPSMSKLKAGDLSPFEDKNVDDLVYRHIAGNMYTATFTIDDNKKVKVLGKVDSYDNPQEFFGIVWMYKENDNGGRDYVASGLIKLVRESNEWSLGDLATYWTWSDFIGKANNDANITGHYKPQIQFNEAFEFTSSGEFSSGSTTFGTTVTVSSSTTELLDASLGKYKITAAFSDGSSIEYYILMGIGKKNIYGVKKISTENSQTAYGYCWGHKKDNPEWYKTSNLAGRFFGKIEVTGGSREGKKFRIFLKVNDSGTVQDGRIFGLNGMGNLGGSIGYVNTTTGEISGTISGSGGTFKISVDGDRNASHGVYKVVLDGDGELDGDPVHFRMHRTHHLLRRFLP